MPSRTDRLERVAQGGAAAQPGRFAGFVYWREAAWLVTLAGATAALRVPLLAPRLAHWDAVNYALGLHAFDIAAHQPHPPGSPYFILLGRAALAVVGDDNAALELLSVAVSSAALIAQYALVRSLFGTRAAVIAALLLSTQPVFWGYGTTASAWTLLPLLTCCIALMCWRLQHGGSRAAYGSAIVLAVASGFRADAAAFLTPLWLWALWRAEVSTRQRILALSLACIGVLAWLIPVAANAGGALAWSERLLALLPANEGSAEVRQLAVNTAIAFGTLGFCLVPSVALALLADARGSWAWLRGVASSRTGVFLGLWVMPAFTFLWLVDSTEPGHDLVYVGGLVALAAGLLGALGPRRAVALAGVVAALQAGVFLFAAPISNRPLAWTLDSMLLNVTAPGLRQHQESLDDALAAVRARGATVVITVVGQDAYRFMMYYLPEYTVVRVDPRAHSVLTANGRTQGSWVQQECVAVANPVWVLWTPTDEGTIPPGGERISATDGPFEVWEEKSDSTEVNYLGFRIAPACN